MCMAADAESADETGTERAWKSSAHRYDEKGRHGMDSC